MDFVCFYGVIIHGTAAPVLHEILIKRFFQLQSLIDQVARSVQLFPVIDYKKSEILIPFMNTTFVSATSLGTLKN